MPPARPEGSPTHHDKAFWRAIVHADYMPPPKPPVAELLEELSGYLGSPDPELRDEIAYSVTATWIYRKRLVGPPALRARLAAWRVNLRRGIGDRGSDSVLLRSFSALSLATLVALDNEAPFLTAEEFRGLLEDALEYLRDERDLRGFDSRKGWIHATAHTADLLKFLARSRYFSQGDQGALLNGVASRLTTAPEVFTHGEDERLARALLSVIAREDFDASSFRDWINRTIPSPVAGASLTQVALIARQNVRNLFMSFHAILSVDKRDTASIRIGRELSVEGLRRLF